MSVQLKVAGAKRDPMMWVAAAATVLGLIQSATSFLQPLMNEYPKAFGIGMFVLSVTVGTLRWYQGQTLVDKGIEAQQ